MPDYMHIVHLAVGPDLVCSVLLDLSDPEPGLTREAKLTGLWGSYNDWCEAGRLLVSS